MAPDEVAIVGIAQTEFVRRIGRSEEQTAYEVGRAALADAGLRPDELDGIFTVEGERGGRELGRRLGAGDIRSWASTGPGGGRGVRAGRARGDRDRGRALRRRARLPRAEPQRRRHAPVGGSRRTGDGSGCVRDPAGSREPGARCRAEGTPLPPRVRRARRVLRSGRGRPSRQRGSQPERALPRSDHRRRRVELADDRRSAPPARRVPGDGRRGRGRAHERRPREGSASSARVRQRGRAVVG